MTTLRTSQDQNLSTIVNAHNKVGPHDLDCSVHFNAYEVTTSKAMGVECCWISTKELSAKVSSAMATAAALPDRGPKERTRAYIF